MIGYPEAASFYHQCAVTWLRRQKQCILMAATMRWTLLESKVTLYRYIAMHRKLM
jgi:hypothetical protein